MSLAFLLNFIKKKNYVCEMLIYVKSPLYCECGSLFPLHVTAWYPKKKNMNNNSNPKGCLMVMADPTDLGHGKKESLSFEYQIPLVIIFPSKSSQLMPSSQYVQCHNFQISPAPQLETLGNTLFREWNIKKWPYSGEEVNRT